MMSVTEAAIDLGLLLAKGYQEFVRELRSALAEQGFDDLGRSDGFVFRTLGDGALTVSELAVRLEISKQGAGQIVDDMARRGYVRRRPDPADGRARPVELAERGRRALAAASAFHRSYERRLVERHGQPAVAALRAVLGGMSGGGAEPPDYQLRALYL
jgi:DNA-binding MarR family transcriptional regulator